MPNLAKRIALLAITTLTLMNFSLAHAYQNYLACTDKNGGNESYAFPKVTAIDQRYKDFVQLNVYVDPKNKDIETHTIYLTGREDTGGSHYYLHGVFIVDSGNTVIKTKADARAFCDYIESLCSEPGKEYVVIYPKGGSWWDFVYLGWTISTRYDGQMGKSMLCKNYKEYENNDN